MHFSVQVLRFFFKSSLKIHHIASFSIPRGHQKTLGLWQRPLPSELMVELTEEAGCLSCKGAVRHSLSEGLSNTSSERKNSKIEEFLNQNAKLLAGCWHLISEPSSAPLAALPHPHSSSSMDLLPPQSLLLTQADLHCSPHPVSASPPVVSSPTDPFPTQTLVCISHSPSSMQQFIPVFSSPKPHFYQIVCTSPLLSYHFDTHSTQPFPPPQQCCTWVVGESRRKGLVERWDKLLACSSCAQASLLLSHGGSITEMLLSAPVIGASWTALKDLLPGQPSAQIKGGNVLSKDRIRNISLELRINTRDSSECVLTAIFQRLTICPNLHKKGKKYIHWQKPPPLTKYWLPASKLI